MVKGKCSTDLEERGSVEDGAISSNTDDEIHFTQEHISVVCSEREKPQTSFPDQNLLTVSFPDQQLPHFQTINQ